MIAPSQIKKPENWQDFEKLCKLLWGELWDCSDTIVRNGRQGQNQHGVDISAFVKKANGYCGIQCKGKDDYSNSKLTQVEIDTEISKAVTFEPKLKRFIFATTANKDAEIEAYIRKKNQESIEHDGFEIYLFSWEDIVDLMERCRDTFQWYVNNCQYKDTTDVSLTFDGEDSIAIHPQYIKYITKYKLIENRQEPQNKSEIKELLKALNVNYQLDTSFAFPNVKFDPFYHEIEYDERWCTVNLVLKNIGSTVIRNMKLIMHFDENTIEKIDDRFHYNNDLRISEVVRAQINSHKDADRVLFQTYENEIEFRPKEKVFVQEDETSFKIDILPVDNIEIIPLYWTFLSENYKKEGCLYVVVQPSVEERITTKEVNNKEDMKKDEIRIEKKITKR